MMRVNDATAIINKWLESKTNLCPKLGFYSRNKMNITDAERNKVMK